MNLQGWIANQASGVGFEELSWVQWGCRGSRPGGDSFLVVKVVLP